MIGWIDLLSGITLGSIVTWIISLLTLRYNYNQLFAETVSQNRMDWMNIWRENLSILIGAAESLHNAPDYVKIVQYKRGRKAITTPQQKVLFENCINQYEQYRNEFYKARNTIISRLNLTEENHRKMFDALNNFSYLKSNKEFELDKAYIIELARAILKPEWERLKREAKGKEK